MNKKIISILIILFGLFNITNVQALPSATKEFYINDFANLLSEDTKNYILKTSVALEKETTAQVVVVTVPSLDGASIEEYATELFRDYGIGTKDKNNGLLLLLALEERQFRVEVGYGLEEVLTDGLTGRYQDQYIIPYLKENNWDKGIKNGYSAFVKKLCEYYNVDTLNVAEVHTKTNQENTSTETEEPFAISAILGVIFGTIIGSLIKSKSRNTNHKKTKNIISSLTGVANIVSFTLIGRFLGTSSVGTFLISEIVMIVIIIFSHGTGYYNHRGGYRTSSRSSSFGGFHGGGGSSGGGGSTRGF